MIKENQPVRDHLAYLLREARGKNFHHRTTYSDLRDSYYNSCILEKAPPYYKLDLIRWWSRQEFKYQESLDIGR